MLVRTIIRSDIGQDLVLLRAGERLRAVDQQRALRRKPHEDLLGAARRGGALALEAGAVELRIGGQLSGVN